MDFSTEGMGHIRVLPGSIRVEGEAEFLKTLYSSHIASLHTLPLHLSSARNITLDARDSKDRVKNKLFIGNGRMESHSRSFEIHSRDGELLFGADDKTVTIGAEQLKVT